ncbi:MAG: hypothetical protein M3Q71_02460 [Chloroflexota bacterium]|nr:hypothetical protein [Actinomycetota bacterium]MDP9469517.1 hypothetical protein [Chloroflexota bacterium]
MSEGLVLGREEDGSPLVVGDHRRPMHILGVPGMGKSTLLGHLAETAVATGAGALLIDIKDGALAADVAARTRYPEKLVYVAPGLAYQEGRTFGLNVLEGPPAVVVDNVLDVFERTGSLNSSFMTQVRSFLTMALRLAVGQPESTTLHDVGRILTDQRTRQRFLAQGRLTDRVQAFWDDFNAQALKSGEASKTQRDAVASTIVRLDQFLVPDILAALLAQPRSTLRLAELLDAGMLVVCNLVEGVPPREVKLLGNLVMAVLVNAALARRVDEGSRHWFVVADEFDLLAADPFVTSLDKLRAARIVPYMAHQNLSQLSPELSNSLSGAGLKVYFRPSGQDKGPLARLYGAKEAAAMATLPKHHARVWLGDEPGGVDWLPPIEPGWTTVATPDWWCPRDPAQLQKAIAASVAYTVPLHPTTTQENDDARPLRTVGTGNTATAGAQTAPPPAPAADPPQPGAGPASALRPDPQRDGGAGRARSVPVSDKPSSRRTVVPRPPELDWGGSG